MLVLAASAALFWPAAGAVAQSGVRGGEAFEGAADEDALVELFELVREGKADPHLPFILSRLKRALGGQDLLGVLELMDPAYFASQFSRHQSPKRTPGKAMGAFMCEFFSICDISKTYGFNDIVSAQVVKISPKDGLTGGPVEVTLELRMWDGLTLYSTVFYDPNSATISAAVG